MKNTILVLGALLLITACSNGGGGNDQPSEAPAGLDTQSCVYTAEQGPQADFSVIKANRRNIIAAAFGKEFNSSLFEGIAQANVLSTIQYINKTEAHVYKASSIPAKGCTRALFAKADSIPGDLNDVLTGFSDPSQKTVILGLYLPRNSVNLPSTNNEAAIIVRENSNRWTLVHEFMHHLFELRTVENGVDVEAARAQFNADFDIYDNAVNSGSIYTAAGLQNASDAIARATVNMDLVTIHFTLEEMTIEKYLKEQLNRGVLKYAPKSTNWYIRKSGDEVLARNNKFLSIIADLQIEVMNRGLTEQVEKLSSAASLLRNRNSEIDRILSSYPADNRSMQAPLALRAEYSEEIHAGCSHEHAIDDIHNRIMNLH